MSRVEDLSAELVTPEVFRDICATVASVGRKCVVTSQQVPSESQTEELDDDEGLTISVINVQNSMQLWVNLSSNVMFKEFILNNPESIELNADTLAQAFRNEAGVVSMTEVKMRVTHKVSRLPSSIDVNSESSQAIPQSHRLVSFHMSNVNMDGTATKVVEQRIYGEYISPDTVLAEPVVDGIRDWADPTTAQLAEMAKVCEQYKQMNEKLRIIISTHGSMTLKSEASDVVATTSWQVEKAEQSNATQDPGDEDESLFVDEEQADPNETQGSPSVSRGSRGRVAREESSCVVSVKDWRIVFQARKMCRRMVIGVSHGRCLVAYGFLKQGRQSSAQDVATFYLWNQE